MPSIIARHVEFCVDMGDGNKLCIINAKKRAERKPTAKAPVNALAPIPGAEMIDDGGNETAAANLNWGYRMIMVNNPTVNATDLTTKLNDYLQQLRANRGNLIIENCDPDEEICQLSPEFTPKYMRI